MASRPGRPRAAGGGERDDNLEVVLPHLILTVARRVSRLLSLRYAEAFDLTVSELSVLHAVGRRGPMSPTMIAEETSMDKVRVSRASATLVTRRLLQQSADPKDGRGRVLRITRRGTLVQARILVVAREVEDALAHGLGPVQRSTLVQTLIRIGGRLDRLEGRS